MGQEQEETGLVSSQLTLVELLKKDPTNAQAWVMLAKLVDAPERKKLYVQRALAIAPNNEEILAQIRELGFDAQQKIVAEMPAPAIEKIKSETKIALESDPETKVDLPLEATIIEEAKSTEHTVVSESEPVDVVENTVVSEERVESADSTQLGSVDAIEDTVVHELSSIEDVSELTAESTSLAPPDITKEVTVTNQEDARTRVQEILAALGVKQDPQDAGLVDEIEDTKVAEISALDTIVHEPVGADTIVQDMADLSQRDTIVEGELIRADADATILQEPTIHKAVDHLDSSEEEEVMLDGAQQRIDEIRSAFRPLEKPAIQVDDPLPINDQAGVALPDYAEQMGNETAVIDPPNRIFQGLLAIAGIVAFSFFARELIELLNELTGFKWPDYR